MFKKEWWLKAKINLEEYKAKEESTKEESNEDYEEDYSEIVRPGDMAMISQDALNSYCGDFGKIQSLEAGWGQVAMTCV